MISALFYYAANYQIKHTPQNQIQEKNPVRILVVGDSLSSDIQGGVNFGIPTIWYNYKHFESTLPDYQVDDLNQLNLVLEDMLKNSLGL